MKKKSVPALAVLCSIFLFTTPIFAHAFIDWGGWVLMIPGVPGSIRSAGAIPQYPSPPGVNIFSYPGYGSSCVNGLDEVNLRPVNAQTPNVLYQLKGARTFDAGPLQLIQQSGIGKQFPGMVCMAMYNLWYYCGISLCYSTFALPYTFDPLILWNGSSRGPAVGG